MDYIAVNSNPAITASTGCPSEGAFPWNNHKLIIAITPVASGLQEVYKLWIN